ncbi:metal ABC transporter solute-binding protein, Zn/Mn family [Gemmatimonadota bacterium]
MKRAYWLLPAVFILLMVAACGSDRERIGDELLIAVSVQPHAWLVEQIGGERVDVIAILSPGDSPSTYQPTDSQISRVMRARLFFRTGVPFEHGRWFDTLASSGGLEIIDLRAGVELRHMEHDHDHEGEEPSGITVEAAEEESGTDPHIWVSPALLKIQAHAIADALTSVDPEGSAEYHRRLESLERELDELGEYIHSRFEDHQGKAFYVFHPAWGYFAEEFGLNQKAIEIEGKDPSDHDLTIIQEEMRADRALVIFIQPQIGSRAVEAVADAMGADVKILDPLVRNVISNLRSVADAIAGTFR